MASTSIGVIGGTGLYELPGMEDAEELVVDTPYGRPSSKIVCGRVGDSQLFFISRHDRGHRMLPTEVNGRANIYALKQLGAEWCIGVSAVGSLREELVPGDAVVPGQLIDRTRLRQHTFFGEGIAAHVQFADPFCPVLSDALHACAVKAAASAEKKIHRGGCYVCMEGPAFSTRAESELHRQWGGSLIGMTALPEAKLCREAEIAYSVLALVTDYDCWRGDSADVDVGEILRIMATNVSFAKEVIQSLVPALENVRPSALAARALDSAIVTQRDLWPADTTTKLKPILERYLSTQP